MTAHRLCALDDLIDGGVRRFDVDGHAVAVVRLGDDVFALGDRCTHQDVSLSEGEVDEDECTLECPKHGAAFRLDSGEPTCLPATQPVPVYEVAVVDGDVMVEVGR